MFLPQLIFIICISKIGAVPLLMSWTSSVRLLDEHNTTHIRAIIPSTVAVVAVDYHFKRNEIYFSDGTGRIKRARLYPDISTSQDPITIAEVRQSDGLAVDWINDNLYWTDVTRMTVEMSTLDGLYRRVLFNSTHGVEMPRGIALDPFQGIMFWTDWGSSERVESAGLDGKSKSTIVTSGMFWPNAVTLDLNRQIVYILEGKLAKIISCNYDGTNQNVVFSSDGYLEQAFGLSFFANRLYWDSWKETAVFSIDLNPVGSVRSVYRRTSLGILQRLTERMMGIKAVDPSLQRGLTVRNPCQSKGCSHKCVNSRGFTASCICPFGFQLQADEKTCLEEGYLLMSWRRTIRRYNLQGKEEESMFDYSKAAISISYHYKKKLVFWSDIEEHRIYRAPLEQLNNKTVVVSTETCDGLAVDWVHDVLYWTDTEQNTLEASQLDGSKRKIIFSDDLDKPRDIAIDPESGYMFWTDWGAKPRIERAVLDGSERRMIVDQQILWPNGITIDFEYHRIYWVDGKMATISSSLYDGSDRRTILEHLTNTPTPFGISLIKDKIYWTDWSLSGLMAGKKSEGIDSYHLLANSSTIILRPYGVKVVHSSLQKEKENPCAALVCSEICLGTKSPQKPHCVGGVLESKGLIKTVKNDSIHLSLSASPPIVMAIIRVKCVGRNGCSNDTRCSSQASEVTLPFLNQTSFNISGLLPASHYDLHFQSPTMSETFQLVTAETDPPELPKITSVKAEERSVTIKWDPVDSCVPGFDSYHYRLLRTHQDPDSTLTSREGNTTDTQVFLDNLQGEVNYTFHLYTLDAAHYSKVTFKTEPADELPVCRTGIFLCNGVNDCADASDESLETCTAIDSITVYKKNDSSVSFRVRVAEGTKRHLHKFVVSGTMSNTPAVSKEFLAVPCVIWSDSYCFSVTSLEYDKVYDFLIQVVLKDGKTGKSYEATARTKEGESGRPEDLTVISLTSTSVELQWSHPNQSNGDIRSFLVYISETDSFLPGQCCQDFPVLNSPVTSEEATYRVEPGSLSPATTYSITISVRTNLVGGSALLQVHTPPPHMKIVKHLRIALPSGKTLTWQPQNVLEEDQPQYHSLVKYYLLLALVDGEEEPQNWRVKTGLGAVQSMVESEIGSRYHLIQRYDEGRVPSEQTLSYYVFPRRYEYRLVWVQVSQYKTVFSVDYIISDKFKTDIVH